MQNIEQIKRSHPIASVIGRYVRLERKGSKQKGLCPFHNDRHPSLVVDEVRQVFTCYACGAKGDVISFIEKIENCSFKEALEKLSPGAGRITSPQPPLPPVKTVSSRPLPDHTPFLKGLMPYVPGHPELSAAYLNFEVGIAPVRVTGIWKALRSRVIFPLRDAEGKLVGFAGRREGADEASPKYINTSSEDGYYRNRNLYGLKRAESRIRQSGEVFLTEGYKDVIAMHAAGFTGTVGLGGVALSGEQIALLKERDIRLVFILMDGDEAGRKAEVAIATALQEAEITSFVIRLPEGDDPDSLFRKEGKKAFTARIEREINKLYRNEWLLLFVCLAYPGATITLDSVPHAYPAVVKAILETDKMPFRCECHRAVLELLATGIPETDFPEELKQHANDVREFVLRHGIIIPSQPEPEEEWLQSVLFRYAEEWLQWELEILMRRVPFEKEPSALFHRIARRREQLSYAAYQLNRNGIF